MYEKHFGLTRLPFQLNPSSDFYFPSKGHARAMSYLEYGVHKSEGFIAITGEVGAGKTTLIQYLTKNIHDERLIIVKIVASQFDAHDMLQLIVSGLKLQITGKSKAELFLQIEQYLQTCVRTQQRLLIIVDEAQRIPEDSLEELRMLSNLIVEDKVLLQIFLLGQPELREQLNAEHMKQLRQRIIAWYHLGPLDRSEIESYFYHRMRQAGSNDRELMDEEVFSLIFTYSEGIPRKINTLCDRILLHAYLEQVEHITIEHVQEVIREINSEGSLESPVETPVANDKPERKMPQNPVLAGVENNSDSYGFDSILWVAETYLDLLKIFAIIQEMDQENSSVIHYVVEVRADGNISHSEYFNGIVVPEADITIEQSDDNATSSVHHNYTHVYEVIAQYNPSMVMLFSNSYLSTMLATVLQNEPCRLFYFSNNIIDNVTWKNVDTFLRQVADITIAYNEHNSNAQQLEPTHSAPGFIKHMVSHYKPFLSRDIDQIMHFQQLSSIDFFQDGYGILFLDNAPLTPTSRNWKSLLTVAKAVSMFLPVFISVSPDSKAELEQQPKFNSWLKPRCFFLFGLKFLDRIQLIQHAKLIITDNREMMELSRCENRSVIYLNRQHEPYTLQVVDGEETYSVNDNIKIITLMQAILNGEITAINPKPISSSQLKNSRPITQIARYINSQLH